MTNNIKIFKLSIGHGFKYVSRGNFLWLQLSILHEKRMTELVLIVVVNMINVYVCFCKVKQLSQTVHAMVAS